MLGFTPDFTLSWGGQSPSLLQGQRGDGGWGYLCQQGGLQTGLRAGGGPSERGPPSQNEPGRRGGPWACRGLPPPAPSSHPFQPED